MLLLTVNLILLARPMLSVASSDGCSASVYRVLDDVRRSSRYSLSGGEEPLCDDMLPPGWYRFMQSGQSRVLSTTCPGQHDTCGTESPAWLDTSTLRNVTRDTLEGEVCVSWSWPGMSDCCLFTIPVTIKYCQDFVSYYLQPTQACNVAYCSHDTKDGLMLIPKGSLHGKTQLHCFIVLNFW